MSRDLQLMLNTTSELTTSNDVRSAHEQNKTICSGKYQSWALTLFFASSLSALHSFLTEDRYRSSTHLADFHVHSSLNHSKKTVVRSWKRALKCKIAPKSTAVDAHKIRTLTPPPHHHTLPLKYVGPG